MLQANSASSGLNCFAACAPLRKGQLAIVPLTDRYPSSSSSSSCTKNIAIQLHFILASPHKISLSRSVDRICVRLFGSYRSLPVCLLVNLGRLSH